MSPNTPKPQRSLQRDLVTLAVTFSLALISGKLCQLVGLPAPYMLGSLFGVWFLGTLIKPVQPWLGVARWFHKPIILGLGTLIGSAFNQEMAAQAISWWPTLLAMIFATIVATCVGLIYLVGVRQYPKDLALLGAIPGGQAEILAVAPDLVEKDYVVALCHLARVAIVFLSVPAVLAITGGQTAVEASYNAQAALPSLVDLSLIQLGWFVGISLIGYYAAMLMRVPLPYLIGPMLLSAGLHMWGIVDLPRISEFVILAQLAIAGAIGARLAKVAFRELMVYVIDAVVNACLIVSTYLVLALILSFIIGKTFILLFLAFIPGGLYEVTVLALIFGFDVAYVSFHHVVRVLLIFLNLPFVVGWLERTEFKTKNTE